jgi:hypothetical protein
MAWIRVDDHFDEHPKMQMIGPLGWGVWLAGLAYCNRNLTDGFIPWAKARTLASFDIVGEDGTQWSLSRVSGMAGEDIDADWIIGLLVGAGLWDVVENGKGRTDGFRVHDYAEYQPSAQQVKAEREATRKRVEAHRNKKTGRFGNGDVTALPERYMPVSNADVTPMYGVSNGDVTTAPTPTPNHLTSSSSPSTAHARAKDDDETTTSSYEKSLGKNWPIALERVSGLFPRDLNPERVAVMLGDIERDVGRLTSKQLQAGIDSAVEALKKSNGGITHVRPYVAKVLTERFREQQHANRR